MLAIGVGPSWSVHLSASLDVQTRGTCLGEFGKLFVVPFAEPCAEPAGRCFMATDPRQIQTCSVRYIRAVVKVTVQWRGMELSLADCCSPSLGSLEGCIPSSLMQPSPHPSVPPAGWFNVSVDVSTEVLDRSVGLPALGQSVVGAAAGVYYEAGCARIHSEEPSTIRVHSWPPSPILPKIVVLRSRTSAHTNQRPCGLACEELLG